MSASLRNAFGLLLAITVIGVIGYMAICGMSLVDAFYMTAITLSTVGYRDGGVVYGMDLVCERGTLRIDFNRGVAIGRGGRWTEVPNSVEADWMLRAVEREWAAMLSAVRDGAPVAVTGAYGRHMIACIEAALTSSRERREVKVAT